MNHQIFTSKATRSFYTTEAHGDRMPPDAVEISPAAYQAYLEAPAKGLTLDWTSEPPTIVPRAGPSAEQVVAQLTAAVQRKLDEQAQQLSYDSIQSAITYADEPAVPKFQAEGRALRAWRSKVWARCYELLDQVQSGARPVPSQGELLNLLPSFEPFTAA